MVCRCQVQITFPNTNPAPCIPSPGTYQRRGESASNPAPVAELERKNGTIGLTLVEDTLFTVSPSNEASPARGHRGNSIVPRISPGAARRLQTDRLERKRES